MDCMEEVLTVRPAHYPLQSEDCLMWYILYYMYYITFIEVIHIALHLLQTGLGIIEGGQAIVPLDLGPRGQLVHGPLRAFDLSRLHGGWSRELVAVFIRMLWGGRERERVCHVD